MPADVAHIGQATESSATASNVRSPRTVLVRCAIARSENGAPVQGHVWLAMQPLLRTPVLCLKPLNGPIEFFFFKTSRTRLLLDAAPNRGVERKKKLARNLGPMWEGPRPSGIAPARGAPQCMAGGSGSSQTRLGARLGARNP